MSIGFHRNDFNVEWAVDNNHSAASNYDRYHKLGDNLYHSDIKDLRKQLENSQEDRIKHNPDIIWASPPCQGFSRANRTGGKNDEINRSMTFEFTSFASSFICQSVVLRILTKIRKHMLAI